jgi:hypothetical protein
VTGTIRGGYGDDPGYNDGAETVTALAVAIAAVEPPADTGGPIGSASLPGEPTPLGRIPLNDVAVTRQPTANTCVPASLDMLLEEIAPGRLVTDIESLRLSPRGLMPADMVGFVDDNLSALGMRTVRGDLHEALARGLPFIAIVDEGHAVLIQGVREVDGVRYVLVRDPLRGAYLEPIADFDARLVRDSQVLAHPAIWGER